MDIGFWEIALVAVAGLIVLGPERLVETVRIGRRLYHMLQHQFRDLQTQVRAELRDEQEKQGETRQQAVRSALGTPPPSAPEASEAPKSTDPPPTLETPSTSRDDPPHS